MSLAEYLKTLNLTTNVRRSKVDGQCRLWVLVDHVTLGWLSREEAIVRGYNPMTWVIVGSYPTFGAANNAAKEYQKPLEEVAPDA